MLELQYYETVMMLYERLGCPEAASRFALAATKQVGAASNIMPAVRGHQCTGTISGCAGFVAGCTAWRSCLTYGV